MLMESGKVKCPLFTRLVVPVRRPRASMLGGSAKAAPYIRVGISQVVWLSVPGPVTLRRGSPFLKSVYLLLGFDSDHD